LVKLDKYFTNLGKVKGGNKGVGLKRNKGEGLRVVKKEEGLSVGKWGRDKGGNNGEG